MPEFIFVEGPADGVATVTLNRPEKKNCMSPTLHNNVRNALVEVEKARVKVLVITGIKDAFCAGMDLEQCFFEPFDDPERMAAAGGSYGGYMVNWLAGDEALITIQPRNRDDLTLELSRAGLSLVGFAFLIVLPLSRRGWVPGRDSFVGAILAEAGLPGSMPSEAMPADRTQRRTAVGGSPKPDERLNATPGGIRRYWTGSGDTALGR